MSLPNLMNKIKLFVLLFFITISAFSQNYKPQLNIEYESNLYHKPVSISAIGLPPKEKI